MSPILAPFFSLNHRPTTTENTDHHRHHRHHQHQHHLKAASAWPPLNKPATFPYFH